MSASDANLETEVFINTPHSEKLGKKDRKRTLTDCTENEDIKKSKTRKTSSTGISPSPRLSLQMLQSEMRANCTSILEKLDIKSETLLKEMREVVKSTMQEEINKLAVKLEHEVKTLNSRIDDIKTDMNSRVKEVVDLEMQEAKSDIVLLEVRVSKQELDSTAQLSVNEKVDTVHKSNQSLKGEIKKMISEMKQVQDTVDRLDFGGTVIPADSEEVAGLSQRLTDLENSGVPASTYAEVTSLRSQVSQIQEGQGHEHKQEVVPEVNMNIVIKNLPTAEGENDNSDLTLDLVSKLLQDGLGIDPAGVIKKAVRRNGRNQWPGVILVTLSSVDDKRKVLRAKRSLKDTEDYKCVYIEPDLPYDVRQQQRNSRMLLSAVGKKGEYKCIQGNIVRRRQKDDNEDRQRDDTKDRQRDDTEDRQRDVTEDRQRDNTEAR